MQILLLWACGSEAGGGYRDLKISVTNSLPGQISYCLFILHPENNCVQPLKSSTTCLKLYPSLPGVEGARALAREAQRADSRRPLKKEIAFIDTNL